MEEYVTLLRRATRTRVGERFDFDGKVHSMHWVPAVDPIRAFPVILAAIFPRMVRVAGRCADGLARGAVISAKYLRDVIRPAGRGSAAAADRDPDALSFLTAGLVSIDPDREVARRYARESIYALFDPLPHPYYEFTLREQGFSAAAALKHMPAGELEHPGDAIPDECIDSISIAGTADECLTRLAAYEGVADEVVCLNLTPPPEGDLAAAYAPIFELASAFRAA
jgi:alkanesulfonate monooxygenase SsuD/methylene tetrahydromethanopterin reductase-like flavin-dependent oxidoreductase (luciferase family)